MRHPFLANFEISLNLSDEAEKYHAPADGLPVSSPGCGCIGANPNGMNRQANHWTLRPS
jgi:hypothetical protein